MNMFSMSDDTGDRRRDRPKRRGASPFLFPALAIGLAGIIFLVLRLTPYDLPVPALEILLILFAAQFLRRDGMVLFVVSCIGLMVVGMLVVPGTVRPLVGMLAVGVATVYAMQSRAAAEIVRDQANLLDLTHDAVFTRDRDGIVTFWNSGAEELYGWSRKDAIGKPAHELIGTRFPRPQREIEATLAGTGCWNGELVSRRRGGGEVQVASRWALRRDDAGQVSTILEIHTDITERKQAETALRRSEQELRLAMDTMPVLAFGALPEGSVSFHNKRWLDFTGIPDNEALGWRWKRAVHPDDLRPTMQKWQAAVDGNTPYEAEYRMRRSDGEYRWCLSRAEPLRDEHGRVMHWYGSVIDIEDRRRAEQDTAEAEQNLRRAVDTIPAHVWVCDADGMGVFFNRRRLDYSGPGVSFLAIVHPEDRPQHNRKWEVAIRTGAMFENEHRLIAADGSSRWFLSRAEAQRDEQGRVVKWFGTNTDINDLRHAEQRIREAERELRAVVDTIPGLIWIGTADSLDFLSKQWAELGISLAEAGGSKWRNFFHPDDLPQAERDWLEATRTGKPYENISRVRRADGEYRWLLHRAAEADRGKAATQRGVSRGRPAVEPNRQPGVAKRRA
jgi:PAS domain S-box-containing protein